MVWTLNSTHEMKFSTALILIKRLQYFYFILFFFFLSNHVIGFFLFLHTVHRIFFTRQYELVSSNALKNKVQQISIIWTRQCDLYCLNIQCSPIITWIVLIPSKCMMTLLTALACLYKTVSILNVQTHKIIIQFHKYTKPRYNV